MLCPGSGQPAYAMRVAFTYNADGQHLTTTHEVLCPTCRTYHPVHTAPTKRATPGVVMGAVPPHRIPDDK